MRRHSEASSSFEIKCFTSLFNFELLSLFEIILLRFPIVYTECIFDVSMYVVHMSLIREKTLTTFTGMQDDGVLQGSAVLYAVFPLSPSSQLHLEIGREIWTYRRDPHVHVSLPDVDWDVG
jgi:hypothetical protein